MEHTGQHKTPTRESLSVFYSMTVWHWLVLLGTVLVTVLEAMLPHSFGTFLSEFHRISSTSAITGNYMFTGATQFQLSWLPVIASSLPCIFLSVFSILIKRFCNWYQLFSLTGFLLLALSCLLSSLLTAHWPLLFLTYSFIYSLGSSLLLAVIVASLADYFPPAHSHHVAATSLFQVGYPISAVIGNPVFAALIVRIGWPNALKYGALMQLIAGFLLSGMLKPFHSSGICFKMRQFDDDSILEEQEILTNFKSNQTLCTDSSTYLDETTESGSTAAPTGKLSVGKALCQLPMWLWLVGKYLNYMCWYGLRTNLVYYLVSEAHYSLETAAGLMSVYASAEIVVALLASVVGDRLRGRLILVHVFSSICMAILCGVYPTLSVTYAGAVVLMLCVGMSIQLSLSFGFPGSIEVLQQSMDVNGTDSESSRLAWVLTNVAAGLGILTSPLLSGLMMDAGRLWGHPSVIFWAQSVGWTLQALLFLLTFLLVGAYRKTSLTDLAYREFKYTR